MMLKLFWWSKIKFQNSIYENYGDLLSKYLVEKISGKKVTWVNPRKIKWWHFSKKHFFGIGSIIQNINKYSVVWGSGIITKSDVFSDANFLAVRGPRTRKRILELGYNCPEIYGDPAILLSKFYSPKVEKKYKLGIIPHYVDYEFVVELFRSVKDIKIINLLTNDIEKTTDDIFECENIISSSLHGVIVSQTFDIPSVWVKFSDKLFGDNVKFSDYFESVDLKEYTPQVINSLKSIEELLELVKNNNSSNIPLGVKEKLQTNLLKACPFK